MTGTDFLRKQLGHRMRLLRLDAGMTRRGVLAEQVIGSTRILMRLEAGMMTTVKYPTINELCRVYGASPDMRRETVRLFRELDSPEWNETPENWLNGTALLIQVEKLASSMSIYDPDQINGLLQTENYIRTRMVGSAQWLSHADQTVQQRRERQANVWNREDPVVARYVIGRQGLETMLGTDQGPVLLDYARRNDITIRVQNRSIGKLQHRYPFTVLSVDGDQTRCVYTEPISGHRYETLPRAVNAYEEFFDVLYNEATPIEEYPDVNIYLA